MHRRRLLHTTTTTDLNPPKRHAFIVTQHDGIWHTVQQIRGRIPGDTVIYSLSCASAGNCSAGGGLYTGDQMGIGQELPFTVTEAAGTWHAAHLIPGITTLLNDNTWAQIDALSCPPVGSCASVGRYEFSAASAVGPYMLQVFVTG